MLLPIALICVTWPSVSLQQKPSYEKYGNKPKEVEAFTCQKLSFSPVKNSVKEPLGMVSTVIGKKVYTEVSKTAPGSNILFSPLSIQTTMAMVTLGAGENTLYQLLHLFGLNAEKLVAIGGCLGMMEEYGKVLSSLSDADNVTLNVANALFVNQNFEILHAAKANLAQYFYTSFHPANFAQPKQAAKKINDFVKSATKNKIEKIVEKKSISTDTKMVLVNAIYFKGPWQNKFHKEATKKGTFHTEADGDVEVDFMRLESHLKSGSYQGMDSIALPYSGGKFTLYIVGHAFKYDSQYKKNKYNMKSSEEDLVETIKDTRAIAVLLDSEAMESFNTKLELPKFKIEKELNLNEILKAQGVTDLFSRMDADLPGFSAEKLYVTEAVHKAVLEVNEEGSEGAAATALHIELDSFAIDFDTKVAKLDRPFLFFIKHEESGMIIFQGKIANPNKN